MKIAIGLFVILMGLDLATTFLGFEFGAQESNPLWAKDFMPLIKILATVSIIALFYVLYRYIPQWNKYTHTYAWALNIIMAAVVINNATVIAILA